MDPISIERLDRAIIKIARLIETTGENYWPVLERLETERDARLSRERRLRQYLSKKPFALAQSSGIATNENQRPPQRKEEKRA
jgi:hypothetical protein